MELFDKMATATAAPTETKRISTGKVKSVNEDAILREKLNSLSKASQPSKKEEPKKERVAKTKAKENIKIGSKLKEGVESVKDFIFGKGIGEEQKLIFQIRTFILRFPKELSSYCDKDGLIKESYNKSLISRSLEDLKFELEMINANLKGDQLIETGYNMISGFVKIGEQAHTNSASLQKLSGMDLRGFSEEFQAAYKEDEEFKKQIDIYIIEHPSFFTPRSELALLFSFFKLARAVDFKNKQLNK